MGNSILFIDNLVDMLTRCKEFLSEGDERHRPGMTASVYFWEDVDLCNG